MTGDLVLTNARIVTRDRIVAGSLHIAAGKIEAIDTGTSSVPGAVDLEGDYLLPGIVDIHTDNLERHLEPRPGVEWPNLAALVSHDRQVAAAGITTVLDSLCVGENDFNRLGRKDALERGLRAMEEAQGEGLLKSEHFLHLRCEIAAADVVEPFFRMVGDPLVRLVSLMDHTLGQRQWSDVARWRTFTGRTNLSDDEVELLLEDARERQRRFSETNRQEIVEICAQRKLALASHDDTLQEHVIEAVKCGVSISEFPTTMTAARLARDNDLWIVMGAPNVVLGGSHSGNVSARALAAQGLVDGLASDYVPISMIHACFLFHEALALPLPNAVATITCNPAEMVGLSDRGEIALGKRADLLQVRAYHHMPVIRAVWRDGQIVA